MKKYEMKDEFPEVFKKEEQNGWYKDNTEPKWLGFFVEDKLCYGFDIAGDYFNKIYKKGATDSANDVKATEQEVLETLKNEAVKRGFKIGSCVDRYFDSDLGSEIINKNTFKYDTEFYYCIEEDYLEHYGFVVYSKGHWAKTIPTKTKEEAEKLLNCKILN